MIQPASRPAAHLLAALYLVAAAFITIPPLQAATPPPQAAVATPALPWHKFSEMAAKSVMSHPFGCSEDSMGRAGVAAQVEHGGQVYSFYGLVDEHGGGRFVIALLEQEAPVYIWVGHSDPAAADVLVVEHSEAYSDAIHGEGPCHVLMGMPA